MKLYCGIVLVLDALLGLAAAATALLWSNGMLKASLPPMAILLSGAGTGLGMAVMLLALSVFAANLTALVLALFLVRGRTIQMPIDGGAVSVAVAAVEQSLARTACALPDVRDVHVRVDKTAGDPAGLRVRARFNAWEGTAVKEVTRRLQEVLKMRVEDIVGAGVPLQFDIRLAEIVLKETKKPDTEVRRKGKKDRQAQPFGGPVYPIDEL